MKQLVFFLLLTALPLFWSRPLQAQASAFECLEGHTPIKQSEALRIVKQVQSSYSKLDGLNSRFTQYSYLLATDQSEHSSGEVWFARALKKMKWHYTEPEEQFFFLANNTVWFYQVYDKQVVVNDVEDIFLSDLPVAFLLGLGDLERDFDLKQACRAGDGTVLELIPKPTGSNKYSRGEDDSLESFKLLVDSEYLPKGANVVHVGGNSTSILLSQMKTNQKLAENLFNTEFPSGVFIDDQRRRRG